MEEDGEREALLIDVYDKEENHGDYTTAWQTASYRQGGSDPWVDERMRESALDTRESC